MAVRLQMNLGLVAEPQRLPDSADTVIAVEPTIGSTSRTKGSLFLLVTGAGGRKLREATKVVAERIRDDYYYDLSAGISVCLRKAVRNANNVLLHSPERPAQIDGESPPIGLALAVVRANELYVATMGPAEAYLIRQARLLTLPDVSPESGLPSEEVDGPEVWHGEITMGDCLILISPNVTSRIGLGPIQDTVGQLHPQGAVDEIHRQFGSGSLGSTGGDGLIVVEATEVASTHRAQPLKPVWPSESRAGAPERSPIPLADTVAGGVVAVQGSARHVQAAADGWLRRGAYSLFDRMPQRAMSRGRVTPMTVRRERQQRAALAVVGLLTVIAVVGTSMWFLAGSNKSDNIDAVQQAQQAYTNVQYDLSQVYGVAGPGSGLPNLMDTDPQKAAGFLKDAYAQLQIAGRLYPAERLASSQAEVVAGLNGYYGVTMLQPKLVASFTTDDLEGLVLGSDNGAYVIDATVATVYRVDLQTGIELPVLKVGQEPEGGGIVGNPRELATAGPDILILDDFNSVWRWRPAAGSTSGRGTPLKLNIPDNTTWGRGARALGTFVTNPQLPQYNLYVVVPVISQILKYVPAADGSSYPQAGRFPYLSVAQDVSTVDDMYIDGKIYLVDKGQITQWAGGQKVTGWSLDPPGSRTGEKKGDVLLRPNGPVYTRLAADNPTQDQGTFYAYDGLNRRVVAFAKNDGTFVGQYMVPTTMPWLSALKGLFVTTGANGTNPTLYWIESSKLMSASLNPSTSPTSQPSASLRPSAGAPSGQAASAGPSKKP
jgi:hypothetical protein